MSAAEIGRRLKVGHVSTVANHFRAKVPRRETVDEYCRVFGINEVYRDLLLGEPATDVILRMSEGSCLDAVDDPHFAPELKGDLLAEWERDANFRRQCLETYSLAACRQSMGYFNNEYGQPQLDVDVLPGMPCLPSTAAFLRAVDARLKLASYRRTPKDVDQALAGIVRNLQYLVTAKQLDAILELTRAILVANGHNLTWAEIKLAEQLATVRSIQPTIESWTSAE